MSEIKGGKELAAALRALGADLAVPLNEASRAALRPMLQAARANAPKDDGDLRRSLAVRRAKSNKLTPIHRLGIRTDFVGVDGAQPVLYAAVQELGSADGNTPGTRFLTRAFEETKSEAIRAFGESLGPAIEKRAAKLAARRAKR